MIAQYFLEIFLFQRSVACEKYEISIQEIQHDERQAERKAEEQNVHHKQFELHKVSLCHIFLCLYNNMYIRWYIVCTVAM